MGTKDTNSRNRALLLGVTALGLLIVISQSGLVGQATGEDIAGGCGSPEQEQQAAVSVEKITSVRTGKGTPTISTSKTLGIWGGEILNDNSGDDFGTVDFNASVQAIDEVGLKLIVVPVEVEENEAGVRVAILDELEATIKAIDDENSSARILAMWDTARNIYSITDTDDEETKEEKKTNRLSWWNTDLSTLLAAIEALGIEHLDGLAIHEFHKDLCYYDQTDNCWNQEDVEAITDTIHDAELKHIAYIPADYRALMHLDDSILLATGWDTRKAGDRMWVEASFDLPSSLRTSTGELNFTWVSTGALDEFSAELDIDGSSTEIWNAGDLSNTLALVRNENISFEIPANTQSAEGKLRFLVKTSTESRTRLPMLLNDISFSATFVEAPSRVPKGSLGKKQRVSLSKRSLDSSDFTEFEFDTASSATYGMSTSDFVIDEVVDGIISILPCSDALDDATYLNDPTAPAQVFEWMDNHLDSDLPRYAVLRGMDANDWSASKWYTWTKDTFDKVLDGIAETNVEGIVVYKVPLAFAATEAGVFSQYTTSFSKGMFTAYTAANSIKIHGFYHALVTTSSPEKITRLYYWDSGDSNNYFKMEVSAGTEIFLDETEAIDEGVDNSKNSCPSMETLCSDELVIPYCEVDALKLNYYRCMRSVDLGDGIPAGSAVTIKATLIDAMGTNSTYNVRFIPVCENSAGEEGKCDLEDGAWTFESGAQIPDFESDYEYYPREMLEALQGRK